MDFEEEEDPQEEEEEDSLEEVETSAISLPTLKRLERPKRKLKAR